MDSLMNTKLAIGASALVVLGLALGASVQAAKSSAGERYVREWVQDVVSNEIPGRLEIGDLGDFELFSPPGVARAQARGVRFLDPDGEPVITVDDATVELDLLALLMFDVRIQRATAHGAEVRIDGLQDGGPRIEDVFSDSDPFQPRRFGVFIENIEVRDVRFIAIPGPQKSIAFEQLEGIVDIAVLSDAPGATVKVRGFRGMMSEPRVLGIKIELTDATGVIATSADKVVDIAYEATVAGAAVSGRFRLYPDDEKRPARLSVDADGIVGKLGAAGLQLQTLFGAGLEVDVK